MIFGKLKKQGILGINRRIGEYILPENRRFLYPAVDDKVETFKITQEANLPTPKYHAIIDRFGDLKKIHQILAGLETFVIKPANGSQGNGILIVEAAEWKEDGSDAKFTLTRQREMNLSGFQYYLSGILSGLYSMDGWPDQILVQERLVVHPNFADLSFKGLPDIRVIVFRGFPVMAMIRFPTEQAGGRANLHQGAVGCGIDIQTGKITSGVCRNRLIEEHPDTNVTLKGRAIPMWDDLLLLAARCYEVVPLGYLGVDLVLDEEKGPLILEMNARPGLAIQLANLTGLEPRLRALAQAPSGLTPKERVSHSQKLFK